MMSVHSVHSVHSDGNAAQLSFTRREILDGVAEMIGVPSHDKILPHLALWMEQYRKTANATNDARREADQARYDAELSRRLAEEFRRDAAASEEALRAYLSRGAQTAAPAAAGAETEATEADANLSARLCAYIRCAHLLLSAATMPLSDIAFARHLIELGVALIDLSPDRAPVYTRISGDLTEALKRLRQAECNDASRQAEACALTAQALERLTGRAPDNVARMSIMQTQTRHAEPLQHLQDYGEGAS